uniref:Uncharacterized protein n=1 Tax=Arundo donax TaxID=35708 RepID=A0A0A9DSN1_ARUDO
MGTPQNKFSSMYGSGIDFLDQVYIGARRILYRLFSESVVGELLPDESAGCDVDQVLYELQWLHLWPITWKFTSETLLQSLQSTQIL